MRFQRSIVAGGDGNGLRLFDPGYLNTAPVRSTISHIDGDKGILRHRGYPIEELAEKSSFLEVAYLLMYGNLPSKIQLADWEQAIAQHYAVPETAVIAALPHDAHPMGTFVGSVCALSSYHPDANPAMQLQNGQDLYKSKAVRDKQIVRVLGKVPTLAAAAYLRMAGRPPVLPSNQLSYSENFLDMLDSLGDRAYKPNPQLAKVLDILFILHAEHEMNCSTAAASHLASSGVDVYPALAGATEALYGPLHGGANEAVFWMLNEIGSVENIPDFLEGVKNSMWEFAAAERGWKTRWPGERTEVEKEYWAILRSMSYALYDQDIDSSGNKFVLNRKFIRADSYLKALLDGECILEYFPGISDIQDTSALRSEKQRKLHYGMKKLHKHLNSNLDSIIDEIEQLFVASGKAATGAIKQAPGFGSLQTGLIKEFVQIKWSSAGMFITSVYMTTGCWHLLDDSSVAALQWFRSALGSGMLVLLQGCAKTPRKLKRFMSMSSLILVSIGLHAKIAVLDPQQNLYIKWRGLIWSILWITWLFPMIEFSIR